MTESLSQTERRSILDALESADEEVRRLAVEQLLLLPAEEAFEYLMRCLGDENWRVRKAAVQRLVSCRGDTRVHEMLILSLADGENPGRRNAAYEAIVASGPEVTERLIREISNSDVDVRKLVIDALAAIGDATARQPLAEVLKDDDANLRAAAAEALGVIGGVDEITRLMEVATSSSEDVLVQLSALRALVRLEASVGVLALGDVLGQSLLRPAGFELLGCSSDPGALDALLKGLESGSRSSREAAMTALLRQISRLDDSAVTNLQERVREVSASNPHLVESSCDRLMQADLPTQMVLLQFLGFLGAGSAVISILRARRDEALSELVDSTLEAMGRTVPESLAEAWSTLDIDLREGACPILGRIGGDVAERLLAEALIAPDSSLRSVAATAIGEGGYLDRVPDLIRRLEISAREEDVETADEVRSIVRAIVDLAEHPEAVATGIDVQMIEVLSSRLAGAAEPIRLAIAHVLARLGREQDEDVISYLLKDESFAVRKAAVRALARFSFDQGREALRLALADESSAVRIAAIGVLGQLHCTEAIEELSVQLADEDDQVAAAAIRAVGRVYRSQGSIGDETAELLRVALSRTPMIALAAIEALVEIGGEATGEMATTLLDHPEPDVVRAAVACLGAHGTREQIGEALSAVAHSDWSVRAEIIQVLMDRSYRAGLPSLMRRLEDETDAFVRQSILRAIEKLEE